MRILADTNIVAQAVRALRASGHDVLFAAERDTDPGDEALLAEAFREDRVFITKDRDAGTLVHRDGRPHKGVLLLDDLGDAAAETSLIFAAMSRYSDLLTAGGFLRATATGTRIRTD